MIGYLATISMLGMWELLIILAILGIIAVPIVVIVIVVRMLSGRRRQGGNGKQIEQHPP